MELQRPGAQIQQNPHLARLCTHYEKNKAKFLLKTSILQSCYEKNLSQLLVIKPASTYLCDPNFKAQGHKVQAASWNRLRDGSAVYF
jgi:hypothetical protein